MWMAGLGGLFIGVFLILLLPRFLPFSLKSRLPKSPYLVRLYLRLPLRPLAKQMLVVARPAH